MGRRIHRLQRNGYVLAWIFGIVLVLAVVGVVVEILRAYWWVFLLAGVALAAVAIQARSKKGGPGWSPLQALAADPPASQAPPRPPPYAAPGSPAPAAHPIASQAPSVPTLRGELVRSRTEARIADLLHRAGIDYRYEATIGGFRPDFYVPSLNLIIEYWGMDTPEYQQRRRVKTGAFLNAGYHLISLEPGDWETLEETLMRKMYRFDKGIYRRVQQHAR